MFTPPPFPANYPPGRVGGKVQGVIRLHRVPFGNKHRERIRADQLFICRDVDILVRNHILNGAVLLHNGILHQHTVAHNSTLLDLAATEQHTVFNGAFHHTAVSQQAVLDLRRHLEDPR